MALESVTIDVSDQHGPRTDVKVQVFNAGGGIIASGTAPFTTQLNPGKYVVDLVPPAKTQASNPYSITVNDTGGLVPQTEVLGVVALAITDPQPAPTCKLFGYLFGGDGRPIRERVVVRSIGTGTRQPFIATPAPPPAPAVDTAVTGIKPELFEVYSDATTGYWEVSVVINTLVRVEIAALRFWRAFIVPNQPQLSVLDGRPNPGPTGTEEAVAQAGAGNIGPP